MKQLLAEQKKKMKVHNQLLSTILISHVVTTPLQASKIAEMEKSLLGVKKIVPQMKGACIVYCVSVVL